MSSYQSDALNSAHLGQQGSDEFLRPFDPTAYDLESSFQLTSFTGLKIRGCKALQGVLGILVAALQQDYSLQDLLAQFMNGP